MTRSIAAVILLWASVSLATPARVEAQLGGLIKKKVKDAVAKPDAPKKDEPSAPAGRASPSAKNNDPTGFGSAIVEITQSSFDELIGGMQMEIDGQAVLKKEIARYGTREQYEACKVRAAQSPEGQKLMTAMRSPPQNVTGEEWMKIQQKVVEDLDAMTNKACPLNPSFWDATKVAHSADSIREEVSESLPMFHGAHLYGVAIERIEKLCEYKGFGSGSTDGGGAGRGDSGGVGVTTVDTLTKRDSVRNPRGAAPLMVPGIGKDIYWMWTAAEVGFINAANCKRFNGLARQLMK